MQTIKLFPPLNGVSEDSAFSEAQPGFARDAQNVMSTDKATGRSRLSSRPGFTKRTNAALNGANKVKALGTVTFNDLTTDFSNIGTGITDIDASDNPTPLIGGGYRIVSSPRGDLYATTRPTGGGGRVIYRYNADLSLISTISVTKVSANNYVEPVFVDEFDNVFVGIAGTNTGGRRIIRYELSPDNEHTLAWSLRDNGAAPHNSGAVYGLAVKNGRLYTLEELGSGDLRVRVFENIYDSVAPTEAVVSFDISTGGGTAYSAGGIDVGDEGNIYVSWARTGGVVDQWCRKYSPDGATTVWTLQSTVGALGGGIGSNVRVRGNIVATTGYGHAGDNVWVRRFTDNGSTVSSVWSKNTPVGAVFVDCNPIAIDEFETIHCVFPMSIHVLGIDEVQSFSAAGPGTLVSSVANDTSNPVFGLALPPVNPNYENSTTPPVVPEFLYIASNGTDYQRRRLVTSQSSGGSTRSVTVVGAAGTSLVKSPVGAPVVPTGGSGVIASASRYVQMASAFSELFIVDGESNLVYDPVEDEVTKWLSTTSGTIPLRCSLIEFWNGRACLSGDPDNRHLLHMSASGDPRNWDLFPPTPTSIQAVTITTMPQIGGVADIINSMCPYSNDLLILFGDHTISLVRGDPAAGGSVDQVTSSIGGSFGRCWCVGPQGEVYFFGSRGGLYAMNPYGGEIKNIGRDRIDRRLVDVNLEDYYVQLLYDHEHHGVLVMVMPFDVGGAEVEHWFVSVKHGGFWPWKFADTDVQPTAACVFDADDPDDRTILIGSEDGYVRYMDRTATVDQGTSTTSGIDAYATMGPLVADDGVSEIRVRDIWASMGTDGDCAWEVYTSHRPDLDLVNPAASGVFYSGANARASVRAKGQAAWVRLRNSDKSGGFTVESISLTVGQGDKIRAGAF